MRVFITGASGFLGSYVASQAVDSGATVAVLARPESDLWRVDPLLDRLEIISGSLDDEASYGPALVAFEPDVVVHLAWNGVMGADRNDARQLTNVAATSSLLLTSQKAGASSWIGIGSQA